MPPPDSPHPVEVFSISEDDAQKALVALKRPENVNDVPPDALVGAVTMQDGVPAWNTLELMSGFKALYVGYMLGEFDVVPKILGEAQVNPGDYVYVIDGRVGSPAGDVPFHDIIGWYTSDDDGRPVAASFEYNAEHLVVSSGVPSSLLYDEVLRGLAFGLTPPAI